MQHEDGQIPEESQRSRKGAASRRDTVLHHQQKTREWCFHTRPVAPGIRGSRDCKVGTASMPSTTWWKKIATRGVCVPGLARPLLGEGDGDRDPSGLHAQVPNERNGMS